MYDYVFVVPHYKATPPLGVRWPRNTAAVSPASHTAKMSELSSNEEDLPPNLPGTEQSVVFPKIMKLISGSETKASRRTLKGRFPIS